MRLELLLTPTEPRDGGVVVAEREDEIETDETVLRRQADRTVVSSLALCGW
jgi:hypothetical protein